MTPLDVRQRATDDNDEWRQRQDRFGDAVAPWWVKFATFFGVPALIAVYLVWHITHAPLVMSAEEARQHSVETRTMNELIQAHVKISTQMEMRHEQQERQIERVLQAICVNGAVTPQDRVRCIEP